MMRIIFSLSLLLLALQQTMAAEMPAAAASCLACHSAQASPSSGAPLLQGQQAFYLQKQLIQLRNAERGGHADDVLGQQMAAIAATLSADDIPALAAYFSTQPAAKPALTQPPAAALLDKGRRLYIGSCGACHGAKAEGNAALNAPALAMLSPDYMQRQLQHFQTGRRGQVKTDKPGRQMALFSRTLTPADIEAVSVFIAAGQQ